jgi:hypothetical protein
MFSPVKGTERVKEGRSKRKTGSNKQKKRERERGTRGKGKNVEGEKGKGKGQTSRNKQIGPAWNRRGGEPDLQLYAMIRIDIASRAWTPSKARNADYVLCYRGKLDLIRDGIV